MDKHAGIGSANVGRTQCCGFCTEASVGEEFDTLAGEEGGGGCEGGREGLAVIGVALKFVVVDGQKDAEGELLLIF